MHYANEARFKHLKYRVALCYRNFAAHKGVSHVGLGNAAVNTAKVLRRHGVATEVWPINAPDGSDLRERLEAAKGEHQHGHPHITHVVISAPWLDSITLAKLARDYPFIEFACSCHSNVGFLMADPSGVHKFRACLDLETGTSNFHAAANSRVFCRVVERTYGDPCAYLPNLYYLDHTSAPHRKVWEGGLLRIGSFGAIRALKNFCTASMAAIQIAQDLRADLEFSISSGRSEGGQTNTIVNAVIEMFRGLPFAKLKLNSWESWPAFRRTVAAQHLMIQVSYTESFNMTTADGIAEGVPSVVSEAIDWLPHQFVANADDVLEIARVGRHLLLDHKAPLEALDALREHNRKGVHAWIKYLQSTGIQEHGEEYSAGEEDRRNW